MLLASVLAPISQARPTDPASAGNPADSHAEQLGVAELRKPQSAAGGDVLALVDGQEIRPADVFPVLFLTQTELMYAALEQTVRSRLMMLEADRLQVRIPSDQLDAKVAGVLKSQNNEFKLAAGPEQDFEEYVSRRYGTSPDVYRGAVRRRVLEELFMSRLIRFEARQHERVQVRLIVVEDVELAREISDKLAEGANFAALARSHSIDPSAQLGGAFPPVARDCPHPLLDGVRELQPGGVSEVSAVERQGKRLFRILRLDRLLPADPRPFEQQSAEIGAELEQRPIDPFEIAEWDRRARERYPIEVRLGRS